jgi:hypothetical protein
VNRLRRLYQQCLWPKIFRETVPMLIGIRVEPTDVATTVDDDRRLRTQSRLTERRAAVDLRQLDTSISPEATLTQRDRGVTDVPMVGEIRQHHLGDPRVQPCETRPSLLAKHYNRVIHRPNTVPMARLLQGLDRFSRSKQRVE